MTSPPVDSLGLDPDILLAVAGDREAFGRIYARTQSTVFRFAYFRCGNRALAEDITSATYVRALARVEHFVWSGTDIAAWFITIARNLLADHYKSGRHKFEVLGPDGTGEEDGEIAPSVEDIVMAAAARGYLRQLVAELRTKGQRRVIELRYFKQLSVAETAVAMGLQEGGVKAVQYRATCALQRLISDKIGGGQLDVSSQLPPTRPSRVPRKAIAC